MTTNYIPSDNNFQGTIQIPQNVSDDVEVSTVNPGFEQLADNCATLNAEADTARLKAITYPVTTGKGVLNQSLYATSGTWTTPSNTHLIYPENGEYEIQFTALVEESGSALTNISVYSYPGGTLLAQGQGKPDGFNAMMISTPVAIVLIDGATTGIELRMDSVGTPVLTADPIRSTFVTRRIGPL